MARPKTAWKPWGDHPVVVAIVVITALIGAGVAIFPLFNRAGQVDFSGRIVDNTTQNPVRGAKVILDIRNSSLVAYTDAEGFYRFFAPSGTDKTAGRVNVEAMGYTNYDRNIVLPTAGVQLDDIRLVPLTILSKQVEYLGRVIDNVTQKPIRGAKVVLDFQGTPPIAFTDSEGVYRFSITLSTEQALVHIRVESAGFTSYDRNITLFADIPQIEDIRLASLPAISPSSIATSVMAQTPTPTFVVVSTPNPTITSAPNNEASSPTSVAQTEPQGSVTDISGIYNLTGTNAIGGSPYKGQVTIVKGDNGRYNIKWRINAIISSQYEGSGTIVNGHLIVDEGRFNADYTIMPDGVLEGKWYDPGGPFTLGGTERLDPAD